MGLKIHIDLSRFRPDAMIARLQDADGIAQRVVEQIAAMAFDEWVRLAGEELNTTSRDYQTGLVAPQVNGRKAILMLTGWLPNAVENGISAFDLRTTLLGENAENRKPIYRNVGGQQIIVGWYNTVPFRHGTPGVTGRNMPEIGSAYRPDRSHSRRFAHTIYTEEEQTPMRKGLYKAMKALDPSHGGGQYGGRLQHYESGYEKLREHHSADIYAGMIRQLAAYESAAQAQYTTFRRISSQVSEGWQHPGIEARRLAQKVVKHVQTVAGAVYSAEVQQ